MHLWPNKMYSSLKGVGGCDQTLAQRPFYLDNDGFQVHDLCVQLRCVGGTCGGYVKRVGPYVQGAHDPIGANFTLTELHPIFERILTYSQERKEETRFKCTALFGNQVYLGL